MFQFLNQVGAYLDSLTGIKGSLGVRKMLAVGLDFSHMYPSCEMFHLP